MREMEGESGNGALLCAAEPLPMRNGMQRPLSGHGRLSQPKDFLAGNHFVQRFTSLGIRAFTAHQPHIGWCPRV